MFCTKNFGSHFKLDSLQYYKGTISILFFFSLLQSLMERLLCQRAETPHQEGEVTLDYYMTANHLIGHLIFVSHDHRKHHCQKVTDGEILTLFIFYDSMETICGLSSGVLILYNRIPKKKQFICYNEVNCLNLVIQIANNWYGYTVCIKALLYGNVVICEMTST